MITISDFGCYYVIHTNVSCNSDQVKKRNLEKNRLKFIIRSQLNCFLLEQYLNTKNQVDIKYINENNDYLSSN